MVPFSVYLVKVGLFYCCTKHVLAKTLADERTI